MKFKIDENLPGELADEFRAAGHVADTVYDEGLSGASDRPSWLVSRPKDGPF